MKTFRRMKNESVEDPCELLLSLVDLGSIDVDEMLIACVSEMSDAECKRVLNSLSLPSIAEDADVEPVDVDGLEDEDEAEELDDENIAEVESRIRRRAESRTRRFRR